MNTLKKTILWIIGLAVLITTFYQPASAETSNGEVTGIENLTRIENFPWKPHRTFDWLISQQVFNGEIQNGPVFSDRLTITAVNGKGRVTQLKLIYNDETSETVDLFKLAVSREDHLDPKGRVLLMYAGDFISFRLDPSRPLKALRITADSWIGKNDVENTDLTLEINFSRLLFEAPGLN